MATMVPGSRGTHSVTRRSEYAVTFAVAPDGELAVQGRYLFERGCQPLSPAGVVNGADEVFERELDGLSVVKGAAGWGRGQRLPDALPDIADDDLHAIIVVGGLTVTIDLTHENGVCSGMLERVGEQFPTAPQ